MEVAVKPGPIKSAFSFLSTNSPWSSSLRACCDAREEEEEEEKGGSCSCWPDSDCSISDSSISFSLRSSLRYSAASLSVINDDNNMLLESMPPRAECGLAEEADRAGDNRSPLTIMEEDASLKLDCCRAMAAAAFIAALMAAAVGVKDITAFVVVGVAAATVMAPMKPP